MLVPFNTTTALLIELLRGPGYGLVLIERVRARGGDRMELRQGAVYPALRALLRRRMVRTWRGATPGSGRPRMYYELTPRGITLAQSHRDVLAGFAGTMASPRPTHDELVEMRERLMQCGEATDAARWLMDAGRKAGG